MQYLTSIRVTERVVLAAIKKTKVMVTCCCHAISDGGTCRPNMVQMQQIEGAPCASAVHETTDAQHAVLHSLAACSMP